MLTWRQAALYQDDETFFRHIIKHNPQARNAYLHLGYALYLQERVEEAVDAARVAVPATARSCQGACRSWHGAQRGGTA